MFKNSFRTLICVIVSFGLLGCSGGGGGSGSTTVSDQTVVGTLSGNGYAANTWIDKLLNSFMSKAYAVNASSPDKVVVIYGNGNSHQLFPIDSTGNFTIDTSSITGKFAAFVVSTNTKQVFCSLNLAIGNDSLVALPKESITGKLNLGRIDTTSNCSSGTTVSNSNAFNSNDISDIAKLARSNGSIALLINNFINDGVQAFMSIRFTMASMSDITGAFNTINANVFPARYYTGSSPWFYLNSSLSNVTAVELFPPSALNYASSSPPVNCYTTTCTPNYNTSANSSTPILKTGLSFNNSAGVTTVETNMIDSFPAGLWLLKDYSSGSVGAQLGQFYLDSANCFDSSGYFKSVIPQLKINTDQSGNVQSIDAKLFMQNSDGTLTQINYGTFSKLIDQIVFSYVLSGSNTSANFTQQSANATDTVIHFTTSSSIPVSNIARVIFSYEIGQSKYQFAFQ